MRRILSVCAVCILAAVASYADPGSCQLSAGPQALIRAAAERERANEGKVRQYTWMQKAETRQLDSNGKAKSTEVSISEYMQIFGEPFERLISKDGKPISDKEKAKQDEKINKLIRERENEPPEQRQKRLEKYDKRQAEGRAFVEELAEAFNFKVMPEEQVAGHTAFVLDAAPKPGYHPRLKSAGFLPKFRFRAWLNSEDCNWIKVDAEAIDTVSIGGIVARIGKGTRLLIEQTEVNDELWLPRHIALKVDGRLMLLKKLNMEEDVTFSDYRKFRSESRITGVQEVSASGNEPQP